MLNKIDVHAYDYIFKNIFIIAYFAMRLCSGNFLMISEILLGVVYGSMFWGKILGSASFYALKFLFRYQLNHLVITDKVFARDLANSPYYKFFS